jgi:hypothetical protein
MRFTVMSMPGCFTRSVQLEYVILIGVGTVAR